MATLTIADLDNGKRDLQTIDEVANSRAASATTRFGQQTTTLYESIRRINATGDEILSNLGFRVPVDYAPGLNVTDSRFTVTGPDGKVYAPLSAPFTTGAWDSTQWYVLQNDLNDRKLLVFDTLMAAETAAAVLPDGQLLDALDVQRRYGVSGGALEFVERLRAVKAAFPGGVQRGLEEKIFEFLSVDDFDAAGDGIQDDSAAIQTAVNSLIAVGGGGLLFPPNGKYLIRSTVAVPGSRVSLFSHGATIINGVESGPALYFGDGVSRYYDNSVEGLKLTGGVSSPASGQVAIVFKKQGHLKITNVVADDRKNPLYQGVMLDDVAQYNVSGLEVQNSVGDGVVVLNCVDGRIVNARSDSNGGQGFWLNGSEGHTFTNCSAFNNTASAWRLASDNPVVRSNKNNWFISCIGDTSGSFNWFVTDSKDSIFVACWGASQKSESVNTFATGFYLAGGNVKNNQFIGGAAYNNNSHGVQTDAIAGAHPEDIRFVGFSFGSTGAALNGNGKSGAGYGLSLSSGTKKVRIDGTCSFENNASGSYSNSGTGNDVEFVGNPINFKVSSYGTLTVGDGGVIPHGLPSTPSWFAAHASFTTELATITDADATNLTVAIKTTSGLPGSAQQIRWEARL